MLHKPSEYVDVYVASVCVYYVSMYVDQNASVINFMNMSAPQYLSVIY